MRAQCFFADSHCEMPTICHGRICKSQNSPSATARRVFHESVTRMQVAAGNEKGSTFYTKPIVGEFENFVHDFYACCSFVVTDSRRLGDGKVSCCADLSLCLGDGRGTLKLAALNKLIFKMPPLKLFCRFSDNLGIL